MFSKLNLWSGEHQFGLKRLFWQTDLWFGEHQFRVKISLKEKIFGLSLEFKSALRPLTFGLPIFTLIVAYIYATIMCVLLLVKITEDRNINFLSDKHLNILSYVKHQLPLSIVSTKQKGQKISELWESWKAGQE